MGYHEAIDSIDKPGNKPDPMDSTMISLQIKLRAPHINVPPTPIPPSTFISSLSPIPWPGL